MGSTLVEKILAAHSGRPVVRPGDIVDLEIDARIARDFGGANVVKNLLDAGLGVADPTRTFFTFDCNPTGSDQKYAANQQKCREFAERCGVRVFDINAGIGTHLAMEQGLAWPGSTLVSTDSHANVLGAIGAFGQGMGDGDIAAAFAFGRAWFVVPPTVQVVFQGQPSKGATAKDLVLAAARVLGASGLLGAAAEFTGPAVESLDLDGRITVASMATEMGGIVAFIPPDERIVDWCRARTRQPFAPVYADPDAVYLRKVFVDVDGLKPLASRPGHPEDVVEVDALPPTRVDSVFIGSCTNGRMDDLRQAARVIEGRALAPGVVFKVVASTDAIWNQALEEGLWRIFKQAGALLGNAGCAGCAAGQIGQNGPGEVTVSTGNRNFPGKQGQGQVWLASPRTAAASAVAGVLITAERLASGQVPPRPARPLLAVADAPPVAREARPARPTTFGGRAWVIDKDNVDTDMIYHNRHLTETDPARMGQHAFGNLPGWEDFPKQVQPGDILVVGANFGCGSSRQQAVTCFATLGVSVILARSFGAIYERNAINEALPVLTLPWTAGQIQAGDDLTLDLVTGRVVNHTRNLVLQARPASEVQVAIYQRGGLLKG
ncbi:MAG: 3-isopropylmalate dehydratase large subunit [Deltaproteobacteria bacterium]|nr:3-isopropylmalate dehydratase large subunit [Deltaproteobacteria bacterium]